MAGQILPAGISDALSSSSSEQGGVNPLPVALPWATDDVLSQRGADQELQPEIQAPTSSAGQQEGVLYHLPVPWPRASDNEVDVLSQSGADQEMQPGMQARYGSTGDHGNVLPWPSPPSLQVVSPDVDSPSRLGSASWVRYPPRRHLTLRASGSRSSGSGSIASNRHPRLDEEQYDEQQDDEQPSMALYLETVDGSFLDLDALFCDLDTSFLEQLPPLDLNTSSVEWDLEEIVEVQSDAKRPRRS